MVSEVTGSSKPFLKVAVFFPTMTKPLRAAEGLPVLEKGHASGASDLLAPGAAQEASLRQEEGKGKGTNRHCLSSRLLGT